MKNISILIIIKIHQQPTKKNIINNKETLCNCFSNLNSNDINKLIKYSIKFFSNAYYTILNGNKITLWDKYKQFCLSNIHLCSIMKVYNILNNMIIKI